MTMDRGWGITEIRFNREKIVSYDCYSNPGDWCKHLTECCVMVAKAILENNVNPEEETFGKDFVRMDLGGEKDADAEIVSGNLKNIPVITMNCHSGSEESMRKKFCR